MARRFAAPALLPLFILLWPDAAAAEVHCPGTRVEIKTPPLSGDPYAELQVGQHRGPFLIDYGATGSSVEPTIYGVKQNDKLALAGPAWPGLPSTGDYLGLARNRSYPAIGKQHGVLGTDLLRHVVVEMHFEDPVDVHMIVSDKCDTSKLGQKGFWRHDQKGFFTASGTTGTGRANVPIIRLDFGDKDGGSPLNVDVPAQIDPGYRDSDWPHTVEMNDKLLERLKALKVDLVPVGTTRISDCNQKETDAPIYVVPNRALRFEDAGGGHQFIRRSFYLLHKSKAAGCGGISQLNEPAAQLGSSFLFDFGTFIFDPAHEAVWLRSAHWRPAPAP